MGAEEFISFSKVSTLIPGRPSLSSVHRWATRGINGVRLKSVRVGGRLFSTNAWTQEFLDAQQAANQTHVEAEAELAAEGL